MTTNEQMVVLARQRIANLKRNYIESLRRVLQAKSAPDGPKLTMLLECQEKGSELFNYIESFVGDSGLLGAHNNGTWITGFAEDCKAFLESLILHLSLLRSYRAEFGVAGATIEPSEHAYANMQRMVKEYLPKQVVQELRQRFIDSNLPKTGFDVRASQSKTDIPRWQLITGLVVGLVLLTASLGLAVYIPNPTVSQWFVFRGLLAISLAAIAPIIPGFLSVTSQLGAKGSAAYFKILAGGSIALFVVIWLANPPPLKSNESGISSTQEAPSK